MTSYTPQRVELEALLQKPGLVVLADVYYRGWRLTLDGHPAPMYRTNFLMRGAAVPAGRHRLVYTYEPASFYQGRWVSVAALVALLVLGLICFRHSHDPVLAEANDSTGPAPRDHGRATVPKQLSM
jgi:uncharacterized membrane protein YfhO